MVNTAFPKGGVHGINTAFKGDSHCPQSLLSCTCRTLPAHSSCSTRGTLHMDEAKGRVH